MCNGMSFVTRKICSIQENRHRIKNYHQQKKVVGAAHFSFQICRYKKEMTMPHDLQLF